MILSLIHISTSLATGSYNELLPVALKLTAVSYTHLDVYKRQVFIFTLGNSTDALLMVKANDAGIKVAFIPVVYLSLIHIFP